MGNDIFYTLLISNFEIEFLKEDDPTNESDLASFFCMRYQSAEWLENIVVLVQSRYGRKIFNANTTAKNSFSNVVQFNWAS